MMFKFLKKSGRRDKISIFLSGKSTSDNKSAGEINKEFGGCYKDKRLLASKKNLDEEEDDDEEIRKCLMIEISSAHSRLSKNLSEILSDKEALGYFIQFMDNRGKLALIKFWMEVECVRQGFCENNPDLIIEINDNDYCLIKSNDNDSPIKSKLSLENDVNKINNLNEPKISNWNEINEQIDAKNSNSILQDAYKIYSKYIFKDHLKTNEISPAFKSQMEHAINHLNYSTLIKQLLIIQRIIYNILETEFVSDFLKSDFHCKHQIDVLTSGNVKLADILFNETAFFYFMEFMELENKRELLDFWMSAISYKHNLLEKASTDPLEAQEDALIIYNKFFSLQATMPLGFSDKIRFEIEQNICREGGDGPQRDCFDKPSIIVYNYLSKHYLPVFLSSQLYYKYLSELISTIQSNACTSNSNQRLKRAGSDCSSELSLFSITTHDNSQMSSIDEVNRPLSSDSNNRIKNSNMNIDTRQLYDPDSLWRRTKSNLSVGYVDNLGRFVTEIEPDPHRKYESRLSRAVKRFIHMEEDKAKEELAWKIAEMIVREITSLTLGASRIPS